MVLLARTAGQLEETHALLRGQGVPAGRISVVPADLADAEDRGRAVAAILAAGSVDILVNNAATVEPLGQRCRGPASGPRHHGLHTTDMVSPAAASSSPEQTRS